MALDAAYLRARFAPVFDTATDVQITAALQEADRRVNRVVLGAKADDAQLYLAAHLISGSMALAFGGVLGATSYTAGPVSMTFGSGGAGAGGRTGFLDAYEELIRGAVPGVFVPGYPWW